VFNRFKSLSTFFRRLYDFHSPRFNPHAWIVGNPEIGEGVWIGAFTLIDGLGGLKIGKGTDISSGVHIVSHSTVWRCVSNRRFSEIERAPVEIGENCFIGENATILRGAQIGNHSIVAAGAVVTEFQKVPPYSMVMGVPARVTRNIQSEIEEKVKGATSQ